MRISAKCEYACRALLALSWHWPSDDPVRLQTICDEQDIPRKYLVQILIQLKRMKLVESIRGKDGGYRLAKPPGRINLGKAIREIGGPLLPVTSSTTKKEPALSEIWQEVEDVMTEVLDNITFEDVLDKAKASRQTITYQI